jgi:Mn2+/Fe2+ NRAMP family transporter
MAGSGGVSRSFREAPIFMGLYTGVLILGALIVIVPGMPLLSLMVVSQFINGVQLPIILVFIVLLVSSRSLMGRHRSGGVLRGIQWATAILLGVMNVVLLVMTAAGVGE